VMVCCYYCFCDLEELDLVYFNCYTDDEKDIDAY
jgi:hypothetical protein